ncbi:MAG: carboxypeptidase-like regulatory domain-containing protein [Bacteroidetes bacterium]|nr:carboxypeptidase-like regulatory domain-containing protein [Bacteroidota bacterium]
MAQQQVTIRGTVFNMYKTSPLEAVTVLSTSGKATVTDSNGNYVIVVSEKDSLSFSYLGKSTIYFPVSAMNKLTGFDIALHVGTDLKEVRIAPRNYHMDSLQNRKDYQKVFDYHKPGLTLTSPGQGLGVGFDLDAIINVFRFQKNRRMLAFQKRLVEEEEDNFIDHRFNRSLVKKITRFDDNDLDSFMVKYKPSYEFTKTTSDYEFYDYIKLAAKEFKSMKSKGEMRKNRIMKEVRD